MLCVGTWRCGVGLSVFYGKRAAKGSFWGQHIAFHRRASRREPEFVYRSAASPGVFIERCRKKSLEAHEEDATELELRKTACSRPNDSNVLFGTALSAQQCSFWYCFVISTMLYFEVHSVWNTPAASAAVSNLSPEAAYEFVSHVVFLFL